MELMKLYNQIENPLDDKIVIEKIIKAYLTEGSFYENINDVEGISSEILYSEEDADLFYTMLYNKLYNNEGFIPLVIKKLIKIPKSSNMEELNKKLLKFENKYLKTTVDYKMSYAKKNYWNHIRFTGGNISHRLYLNVRIKDIYRMAMIFDEKCNQYDIPYYYKFESKEERSDSFVIYSDTENFSNYIQILKEIKKEYPELVSNIKTPPLLTGKIDRWIGYGSQPIDDNESFNNKRMRPLIKAIENSSTKWVVNNRNKDFIFEQKKMKLEEYLVLKLSGKNFNKNEDSINIVAKKVKQYLNQYSNVENKTFEEFNDLLDSNYKICEIILPFLKSNKDFAEIFKKEIIEISKEVEIDPNNFCFDTDAIEKFKKYDQSLKSSNSKDETLEIINKLNVEPLHNNVLNQERVSQNINSNYYVDTKEESIYISMDTNRKISKILYNGIIYNINQKNINEITNELKSIIPNIEIINNCELLNKELRNKESYIHLYSYAKLEETCNEQNKEKIGGIQRIRTKKYINN